MNERLSVLFTEIAHLAERRGVSNLEARDGCWEVELAEYKFSVNGKGEPQRDSRGFAVPGYSAAFFTASGFPLGTCNPFDGIIIGDGTEDVLIEALRAA